MFTVMSSNQGLSCVCVCVTKESHFTKSFIIFLCFRTPYVLSFYDEKRTHIPFMGAKLKWNSFWQTNQMSFCVQYDFFHFSATFTLTHIIIYTKPWHNHTTCSYACIENNSSKALWCKHDNPRGGHNWLVVEPDQSVLIMFHNGFSNLSNSRFFEVW